MSIEQETDKDQASRQTTPDKKDTTATVTPHSFSKTVELKEKPNSFILLNKCREANEL